MIGVVKWFRYLKRINTYVFLQCLPVALTQKYFDQSSSVWVIHCFISPGIIEAFRHFF